MQWRESEPSRCFLPIVQQLAAAGDAGGGKNPFMFLLKILRSVFYEKLIQDSEGLLCSYTAELHRILQ